MQFVSVEVYATASYTTYESSKRKRPRGPGAPAKEATRDGDAVRDVLSGHDKTEDSADRGRAREGEEAKEERDETGEPNAVNRRMGRGVDAIKIFGSRQAAVSGESEYLPGACSRLHRMSR